jgi:hypothetical protein
MKTLGVDELGSHRRETTHRRGFWLWYGNFNGQARKMCSGCGDDASPNMIEAVEEIRDGEWENVQALQRF